MYRFRYVLRASGVRLLMGGGSSKRARKAENAPQGSAASTTAHEAYTAIQPPSFNPSAAPVEDLEILEPEPEPEPVAVSFQPPSRPHSRRRGSWHLAPTFDVRLAQPTTARMALTMPAPSGFEYSFALERNVLHTASALNLRGPVVVWSWNAAAAGSNDRNWRAYTKKECLLAEAAWEKAGSRGEVKLPSGYTINFNAMQQFKGPKQRDVQRSVRATSVQARQADSKNKHESVFLYADPTQSRLEGVTPMDHVPEGTALWVVSKQFVGREEWLEVQWHTATQSQKKAWAESRNVVAADPYVVASAPTVSHASKRRRSQRSLLQPTKSRDSDS